MLGVGGRGGGREPGATELRSPSPRPGEARGEGRAPAGGWCMWRGGRAKGRGGAQGGRGGPPTRSGSTACPFRLSRRGWGASGPMGTGDKMDDEERLGPPGPPGVSCPSVPMRGPRVAHLGMNRESALQLGLCYCKFRTGVFQLFGHCPLQGLLFRLSGSPLGAGHLGGEGRRAGSADRLVSCPSSVSLHCTAGRAGVSRSPA